MSDNQESLTKCLMQLEEMDIRPGKIRRNLSIPELLEVAIQKGEGELSCRGALSVKTGKFTEDRQMTDILSMTM